MRALGEMATLWFLEQAPNFVVVVGVVLVCVVVVVEEVDDSSSSSSLSSSSEVRSMKVGLWKDLAVSPVTSMWSRANIVSCLIVLLLRDGGEEEEWLLSSSLLS